MRAERKPAPILAIDSRAIADDRPAMARERAWPLAVAALVVGLALGAIATLLWARAEFAAIRKEMRERPGLDRMR